jgi:hypothetical protein
MNLKVKTTSPGSAPAQDARRRAGARGLRSNRRPAAATGRAKTRRAPPLPLQPSPSNGFAEAPLTAYERGMSQLVSVSVWGGMIGFLFLQRDALFAAARLGLGLG